MVLVERAKHEFISFSYSSYTIIWVVKIAQLLEMPMTCSLVDFFKEMSFPDISHHFYGYQT